MGQNAQGVRKNKHGIEGSLGWGGDEKLDLSCKPINFTFLEQILNYADMLGNQNNRPGTENHLSVLHKRVTQVLNSSLVLI